MQTMVSENFECKEETIQQKMKNFFTITIYK